MRRQNYKKIFNSTWKNRRTLPPCASFHLTLENFWYLTHLSVLAGEAFLFGLCQHLLQCQIALLKPTHVLAHRVTQDMKNTRNAFYSHCGNTQILKKKKERQIGLSLHLAFFPVGITGLEPATSRPPDVCATNCAKSRFAVAKVMLFFKSPNFFWKFFSYRKLYLSI